MAVRTMENECLIISVCDHGAELCRIYDKKNRREVLWNGDPVYWNRHAPILFPFVGKVCEGEYRHDGQTYEMKSQHGFARDMEFDFAGQEVNRICHQLCANEETRRKYPFDFALKTEYVLVGNALQVRWTVENRGEGDMYFSIGGHPAFCVPALPGTKRSDYYLSFEGQDCLEYIRLDLKKGLAIPEVKYTLPLTDGKAPIADGMFDKDALVFENGQIKKVGIALPDGTPYVTMYCEQFDRVGIWSKPEGPFVCLEPWAGRTDDLDFAGELKDKTGESCLHAGESMRFSHTIEIYQEK